MEPGLRERKKQRTRDALVAAAVDLFQRQGYEHTTVAQIAEAAELSTRTFFLHFPTKEDVLLANTDRRIAAGVQAITTHRANTPLATVLLTAMERMIDDADPSDLTQLRAQLLVRTPALQARLFQRLFSGQTALIDALTTTFDVDRVEAAARVGAMIGAVNAATLASLDQGDPPSRQREAMTRAARLAVTPPA
ncbi:TetR/AcrR family transcriptional regulator [Stackebrandtia nassauensis]|uniref:Transcriptional regulator, TetR family n=1 Tax=Stackebrandtia nassauensis (strain DSM 44728 / CIP 108903 / NRRL B-16338 / NBRC 102104 / LLR-40K-21) TaxID=446470 RepID=D3Q0F9_STANL|nr:TetR/AcrR family transcriptional regulator [Stackebrandtia nassauensis]ADD39823.1 transcriptional regulator, TetR family [Stackebrandtia nassauensis DSM 44728]